MNDKSDLKLAAAMIREATETSPPFSADLHEKIMQRIKTDADMKPEANAPLFRIGWKQFAAAAAVLIVTSILVVNIPITKPGKKVAKVPTIPAVRDPVTSLAGPVGDSLAEARFAYLDRDARSAFHYVADQVDVVPANR